MNARPVGRFRCLRLRTVPMRPDGYTSDVDDRHDLTTTEGRARVVRVLEGLMQSPAAWIVSPLGKLAYELSKRGSNKEQVAAAVALIRAGKEQGLRRLRIRLDERAGVDIGAAVEGVPIKTTIVAEGTIRIEAEYDWTDLPSPPRDASHHTPD